MALRVADPTRLRLAGLVATVVGVVWVVFGAMRGPVLLLGLPVMALGAAAFDLAREGRASPRQAGLVVAIVAAGVALWAFFVILFIGVLDEGSASWVWYVVLLLGVAAAAWGLMTRLRPQSVSRLPGFLSFAANARRRERPGRGRHAAPTTRPVLTRRAASRESA